MRHLRNKRIAQHAHPDSPENNAGGGVFLIETPDGNILIQASNGLGWDHVSVSLVDRCPTWQEMEMVKRLFFYPEEVCMQLHVAESEHISVMPYCLHIWRPQKEGIPLPPSMMVA